jgi:CRP/FNR family transcriptional regulator, cyclic AMP receptor protein
MSARKDLVSGLAAVPLFSACSKRDLQIVARHAAVVDVPAGTAVVEEGARGDAFFFILSGDAVVRRRGRKVATLGPGRFFGELALLDPGLRDATVIATSPLTVGVLAAEAWPSGSGRRISATSDTVSSARRLRADGGPSRPGACASSPVPRRVPLRSPTAAGR